MNPRPLSVVVPCYNEKATIRTILDRVAAVACVHEIIVVDDCSKDGTRELLREISAAWPASAPPLRVHFQARNGGKGAALGEGFRHVTGELAIVQDADLELDPGEYPRLIEPILTGKADVVYGSRFKGRRVRAGYFLNSLANRVLTTLSNLVTGLRLTDMETCYKVFPAGFIRALPIRSRGFGIEPEVTSKVARAGCRVVEVPISYEARTYAQGKKMRWSSGLEAIWIIVKFGFLDDLGAARKAGRAASPFGGGGA